MEMSRTPKKTNAFHKNQLEKCPTGTKGFDEITEGGLPKNRTTLICGGAGSGKTLFGIDFIRPSVTESASKCHLLLNVQ
jgi:circadian clock protein KaiC